MHPAHALDEARRSAGFRTVGEVAALAPAVLVLDPPSVLISTGAMIGAGATLYPGTPGDAR